MPHDHVQITNGVVLAQPHLCPPYVYELMLRCWTESASARLPIQGVVTELTSMTSNPAFDVQVRTHVSRRVHLTPCSPMHVAITTRTPQLRHRARYT